MDMISIDNLKKTYDEAFAIIKTIVHKSKMKAMLKLKSDADAQANVLPMNTYTKLFHNKEISLEKIQSGVPAMCNAYGISFKNVSIAVSF